MTSPLYASANGIRVTVASVAIPYYGAAVADVALASGEVLSGKVTLQIANLTLVMAVIAAGSFAGVGSARLVGGAGGWGKTVDARTYANPAGVRLSLVLGDAARAVGETVKLAQDQTLGPFFIREAAPAGRLLRQLAGALWWMDPAGVTQVATARPSAAITSAANVGLYDPGKRLLQVATEDLAAWMPGATYTSPTVPQVTVSETRIATDNKGVLRLEVLAA